MTVADVGRSEWQPMTLGDLGTYHNGRGFKKSEWSDHGRMIVRIQDLTGTGDRPNYFEGDCDVRHVVLDGDFLISWAATLDAFLWRGPEAVLNQHIFKVESRIDKRFHFYLVKRVLADLRRRAHGSGMVHITKRAFEQTRVAVPVSRVEQARIADGIEQQLTRLDVAESSLRRSAERLKRLRASILVAAWRGELGGISERASMEQTTLGELAWHSDYGTSQKATYDVSGPPIIRIPNVVRGRLEVGDLKYGTRGKELKASSALRPGDFLLVRTNGSRDLIGRAAIVEADLGRDHFHASYLIRFRLKGDPTLWRWVSLIWASPAIRVRLEALAATSAGQYNLNLGALSRVVVAVPPAGELQAMVDELERQLSSLDELGRVLTAASRRLPSLRDSVLGEAFRGRIS